jgi:hypothetical protein
VLGLLTTIRETRNVVCINDTREVIAHVAPVGTDQEIGWAGTSVLPIFHRVRTWNKRTHTGVSRCGASLANVGPRSAARAHERECADCSRPPTARPARPPRKRPVPAATAPVAPEHLRLDPDGHLVLRTRNGTWIVLDLTAGEVTGQITEKLAKTYPTLRSRMPPVDLLGGRDLAAEWDMTVTAISQLQARYGDNFPAPNVRLGGRAGWFPERLRELTEWNLNRGGRGYRRPE